MQAVRVWTSLMESCKAQLLPAWNDFTPALDAVIRLQLLHLLAYSSERWHGCSELPQPHRVTLLAACVLLIMGDTASNQAGLMGTIVSLTLACGRSASIVPQLFTFSLVKRSLIMVRV